MTKTCTKCGVEKPLTEFHKEKKNKDGRAGVCKPCRNEYYKAWRRANEETVVASRRKDYEKHKDKYVARANQWNKKNPDKFRKHRGTWKSRNPTYEREYLLLRRYGITLEQYNQLLEQQDGRCAVCGKPQGEDSKRHHVDHDHDTGVIRGLLCNGCNGLLDRQDVENTVEMNAYLDRPPAQAVLGEHRVPGW